MELNVEESTLDALASVRARYLEELHDYVVYEAPLLHDATKHFAVSDSSRKVGYVSYETDSRMVLEGWVEPEWRERGTRTVADWIRRSGATHIRSKSNDIFLTALLDELCREIGVESVHFERRRKSSIAIEGAVLRPAQTHDQTQLCGILCRPEARELEIEDEAVLQELIASGNTYWALQVDGLVAGVGAVWYNRFQRKFVDIGMVVHPDYRRRGIGAFILQELSKVCEEKGLVPRAGCFVEHEVSRRTLERAGFEVSSEMMLGEIG